jgi:hypothetical protein
MLLHPLEDRREELRKGAIHLASPFVMGAIQTNVCTGETGTPYK